MTTPPTPDLREELSEERYYDYILRNSSEYGKLGVNGVEAAVYEIWSDVTDRRGIKHEFEQCDEGVKKEIIWRR